MAFRLLPVYTKTHFIMSLTAPPGDRRAGWLLAGGRDGIRQRGGELSLLCFLGKIQNTELKLGAKDRKRLKEAFACGLNGNKCTAVFAACVLLANTALHCSLN